MIDFKALQAPFPSADVEWRIAQAGQSGKGVWAKCLAYLTNRAIMQRLDDVCGPGNWRNEFRDAPGGGILCGIAIRVQDTHGGDEWVTKWDGAGQTEIEAVKGGLSGAMKRAAVQWGIGRYLYDLPEGWANVHDKGAHYQAASQKKGTPAFKWDPPALPDWALPAGKPEKKQQARAAQDEIDEAADEMGDAFDEANPVEAKAEQARPRGSADLRDQLLKSVEKAMSLDDVRRVYEAMRKYRWDRKDGARLHDAIEKRRSDFMAAK